MTREEILKGLKEIFALAKPKLDPDRVVETANLVTDLEIDSLSMLLISLGIENRFGFRFATRKPFQTVAQVIDYIEGACGQ